MSREKLLRTFGEWERIFENLSQNELKQVTKLRRINNYKNMSREELLTGLLKSKKSHAELRRSKDNNAEIEDTEKCFNELRNSFSKEKIKKIRSKFRFREGIDLKELEKKNSLTEQQKRDKEHYTLHITVF